MKIIHYSEAFPTEFDSGDMKGTTGRVVIGKADGADNFYMRVFELAKGTVSHRHTHEWEHEVFVHSGKGDVLCDGSWIPVKAGSVIFIPGNEDHQLRNLHDEPFVFVCLVPTGAPEM
jgi:quercetin dioxygenase-like cupin family protein